MSLAGFFIDLRTRLQQTRFQTRMALARYRLATTGFGTGLNRSAWLLYGLARSIQPVTIVEIGSARGWSACHLALALREDFHGRLYAIDPHENTSWNDRGSPDTLPALKDNLRRCGVESRVEIIRARSEEAARGWSRPIDLLFIDGDHTYEGVKRDWDLFSPHLAPFGVAVFHDTTWELHDAARHDMGVPRFLEELRLKGYPIVTIDRDCGLSLVQGTPGGRTLVKATG